VTGRKRRWLPRLTKGLGNEGTMRAMAAKAAISHQSGWVAVPGGDTAEY